MNCKLLLVVCAISIMFCAGVSHTFDEFMYSDMLGQVKNVNGENEQYLFSDSLGYRDSEIQIDLSDSQEQSEMPHVQETRADIIHLRDQEESEEFNAFSIELSYAENGKPIVHLPRFRYDKVLRVNPQEQRRREHATQMAINNHLKGQVFLYGQKYPIHMQNGNIALPLSLSKLPVSLTQFQVITQREQGTCGSRSVANALALRDVVAQGLTLDARTIQEAARKYESLHTKNGMTSREQIQLARRFDLHHTYALAFFKNDPIHATKVNPFPFMVIESTDLPLVNLYRETEILEEIVHAIRSQSAISAHFLCHLEGVSAQQAHAVVVSIVKRTGKPTQMIYMDSNNLSVISNSQAAAYICYLYWQCIAA